MLEVLAPPTAADDADKTQLNKPVLIDILSNDKDLDGTIDPTSVVITKDPENGTVTIDKVTGKVTYTPNPDYYGTDSFEYTVKDNHGQPSNPAKVLLEVLAPPTAVDDADKTQLNKPVVIDILSNDKDLDGRIDPTTVSITKDPENGTLNVDPVTGKVTYTPNPDYYGTDSFEYTVNDNHGQPSNPAKVVLEVLAPPTAVDDADKTQLNKPVVIDILSNDKDLDGTLDPTSVVITTQPSNGKLDVDKVTGKVTYTPNPDYYGTDSFEYTVKDNHGQPSNPAKVVLEVLAPPTALDDADKTQLNKPVLIDILSNDKDLDGTIDPTSVSITKQPSNGKVDVDPVTGKVTYTPNLGYHGTDSFEYTVKDNHGQPSNPAKVVLEVLAPPTAVDDADKTQLNKPVLIDILSNDKDLDGTIDPTTVIITKDPENGTLSVDAKTGQVTYTPNVDYYGTDSFEYTVKDNHGQPSNPAKVVLEVLAPPTAVDDADKTQLNKPVVIDILSNDKDLDGTIDPTTVSITKQPSNGKLDVDKVTGKVTYTPNPDYYGTDSFEYTVKDNHGQPSNPAKVVLEVLAPPTAVDDTGTTKQNKPLVIDILSNDKDLDGTIDPTTVSITTQPENGTLSIDPVTGKVTYTPKPGYHGPDSFEYTVKDNHGQPSNPAKVLLDVTLKSNTTAAASVAESGLQDPAAPVKVTGELSLDNPSHDEMTDLIIGKPATDVTSGGEPVSWAVNSTDNTIVGSTPSGKEVMTITLGEPTTSNGKTTVPYTIELKAPVDHAKASNDQKLDLDFGISSNVGDAKLTVSVQDDQPVAGNVPTLLATENTFYANVIISLDFSSSMGKADSGLYDAKGHQKTRYDAAVDAIETMLNAYQKNLDSVAPGKGDVKVNFSGFADSATQLSPLGSKDTWISLADAQKIVAGLRLNGKDSLRPDWQKIGVNTNYDAALQQIVDSYIHTKGAGPVMKDGSQVTNDLYFITDGMPNMGNVYNGAGISPKSPSNYTPGHPGTDIGEDKWIEFLKANDIKSVAVGIGPEMEGKRDHSGRNGKDYLAPIAYDGQAEKNDDGKDVIVMKDLSQLGNVLAGLVPESKMIKGMLGLDADGKPLTYFGADGAGKMILEVDGQSYTYDYSTGKISSSNPSTNNWKDMGDGSLEVTTNAGGTFSLNMSAKDFGEFSYKAGATRPSNAEKETFKYTLVDKDGDTASNALHVDIKAVPIGAKNGNAAAALKMSSELDQLDVFSEANTLDNLGQAPTTTAPVNADNVSLSQHLEQLAADQSNLI